jgi:uncharacterized membrane protein YqjE
MNHDQQNTQGDGRRTVGVGTETRQEFTAQASGPVSTQKQDYDLQRGPEGLGALVNGVISDVQNIVRNEVRLAQVELKQEAGTLTGAAAMGVVAALAGLVGFILLMIGVSLLLAQWLDDWLAFVIGGVALFLIAGVLAMTAKSRVSAANLKPERTIDSLQQDKAWAQDQAQSLKENQT